LKKIELGYGIARIWYSFPIRAFDNKERANSPLGAQIEPLNQRVERFLALMCFEKRDKLAELPGELLREHSR
jgi:hypothetical protein